MSYHYDATMTKSRMEMTNFGCAQLEAVKLTDLNADLAKVEKDHRGQGGVSETLPRQGRCAAPPDQECSEPQG